MFQAGLEMGIGGTPMRRVQLRLNGLVHTILLKLESFNVVGSIKDRVAWYMLNTHPACRDRGDRHVTLVEGTSGNFGAAVSYVASKLGLRFVALVEPTITQAKADKIRKFGGEVVYLDVPPGASQKAVERQVIAERLAADPNAVNMDQYTSPLNPEAHAAWTAPEAFEQAGYDIDAVALSGSSGGTLAGFSAYVAEHAPDTEIWFSESDASRFLVDPSASHRPTLAGFGSSKTTHFGPHCRVDRHLRVPDARALAGSLLAEMRWDVSLGPSAGGILAGAIGALAEAERPMRVMCLCPDARANSADVFARIGTHYEDIERHTNELGGLLDHAEAA